MSYLYPHPIDAKSAAYAGLAVPGPGPGGPVGPQPMMHYGRMQESAMMIPDGTMAGGMMPGKAMPPGVSVMHPPRGGVPMQGMSLKPGFTNGAMHMSSIPGGAPNGMSNGIARPTAIPGSSTASYSSSPPQAPGNVSNGFPNSSNGVSSSPVPGMPNKGPPSLLGMPSDSSSALSRSPNMHGPSPPAPTAVPGMPTPPSAGPGGDNGMSPPPLPGPGALGAYHSSLRHASTPAANQLAAHAAHAQAAQAAAAQQAAQSPYPGFASAPSPYAAPSVSSPYGLAYQPAGLAYSHAPTPYASSNPYAAQNHMSALGARQGMSGMALAASTAASAGLYSPPVLSQPRQPQPMYVYGAPALPHAGMAPGLAQPGRSAYGSLGPRASLNGELSPAGPAYPSLYGASMPAGYPAPGAGLQPSHIQMAPSAGYPGQMAAPLGGPMHVNPMSGAPMTGLAYQGSPAYRPMP